ncbi:MAG: chromosomal replication initiator protein DnaA [Acidimicrobiaceae bacterium]|nr:chromosomal replication initiator protein DnaA [Acidimicrobiaceae bacterium]|tara:strand:+ start:219 stop:1736 length:1518 start_codon:yes stop_codon:yes gene_type:complete
MDSTPVDNDDRSSKVTDTTRVWNANDLWEQCADAIRSLVSDVVYQMTFSAVEVIGIEDDEFVLSVPSAVTKGRMEDKYGEVLREVFAEATDEQLCPRVEVRQAAEPEDDLLQQPPIDPLVVIPPDEAPDIPVVVATIDEGRLPLDEVGTLPNAGDLLGDPADDAMPVPLTFDDFVIGTSNRFAHAAALAVAGEPGKHYNPLFIYGSSGLGKTHLLRAVASYVLDHYPRKRVRYVSSEEFMNRFVEAIRNKSLPEFKQRYREIDVLLVDDVQFLAGKEGLQEEFFHTFKSVHEAGGQILLSSDRPPDEIPTLEDRLRSRFKMGLTTDVQPPDVETRLAILHKKAEKAPTPELVGDGVLAFIAENITDNIRELEGALTRIIAFASLNQMVVTVDDARTVLSDLITSNQPRPITPEVILRHTSELYGFTIMDLIGPSRRRPLVTARQIAMYVFRDLTDLSFPAIGREFGDRDHTTVIHAVDKIQALMGERQEIYDQVTSLTAAIKTGD